MDKIKKQNKKEIVPCEQNCCAFRNNGCRACESCGCEPNYVDNCCERCWTCEMREGRLRWGEADKEKEVEAVEETNKNKMIMVVAR